MTTVMSADDPECCVNSWWFIARETSLMSFIVINSFYQHGAWVPWKYWKSDEKSGSIPAQDAGRTFSISKSPRYMWTDIFIIHDEYNSSFRFVICQSAENKLPYLPNRRVIFFCILYQAFTNNNARLKHSGLKNTHARQITRRVTMYQFISFLAAIFKIVPVISQAKKDKMKKT